MKEQKNQGGQLVKLFFITLLFIFFQSCKKTVGTSITDESSGSTAEMGKGKPHNPPPPPPPFYFSDCSYPVYAATFIVGEPANTMISKTYVNSPGGNYAAFSQTVNGITFSAPAGTFNAGSGTIVFSATGTPPVTGFCSVTLSVGNIIPCSVNFKVANPPASGPTVDPGPTVGSTGVINFIYKGQSVAYKTVRAGDGRIWLQQNLGSPQVAFDRLDESSYGDYFQWGRWDDGHQASNSPIISGGSSLANPSFISSGNPNFIAGWWGTGTGTDTWSGTTATTTNGKDPCAALGAGWHLPTAADWQNVASHEDLEGTGAAFQSSLKLTAAGYRDGTLFQNSDNGHYWTASPSGNYSRVLFIDDNTYSATIVATERGIGFSCRCVK